MRPILAIALDCDGVILDANHAKSQAFAALLAGDFGVAPPSLDASALVDAYAHAVDQIYPVVSETQHIREFLGAMRHLPLFVVSGSEQAQLRDHLARRGLSRASIPHNYCLWGMPSPTR